MTSIPVPIVVSLAVLFSALSWYHIFVSKKSRLPKVELSCEYSIYLQLHHILSAMSQSGVYTCGVFKATVFMGSIDFEYETGDSDSRINRRLRISKKDFGKLTPTYPKNFALLALLELIRKGEVARIY